MNNSNQNCPFTNSLLLSTIRTQQHKSNNHLFPQLQTNTHSLTELKADQQQQCQQTPQFSRNKQNQACSRKMKECQQNVLSQLLDISLNADQENEQPISFRQQPLSTMLQQLPFSNKNNQELDYSHDLKNMINKLQAIAQQEIARLKQELEDERNYRTIMQNKQLVQTKQVGTNTEIDFREQQIVVLKQCLLRQSQLNKQLLKKQLKQTYNMQNLINQVGIDAKVKK